MITFEPYSILFYSFGIIIPTIMLLFSYGVFAYKIGEYNLDQKERNLPTIIVLLLSKLFVISFVMFYIFHYIFDNTYENKAIIFKVIFWGLLITIDCFILNKELIIACRHFTNPISYGKYISDKEIKLRKRYKVLFWIRNTVIVSIIALFGFNFGDENLSFTLIFLLAYIYYNYRIDKYIKYLQKYDE